MPKTHVAGNAPAFNPIATGVVQPVNLSGLAAGTAQFARGIVVGEAQSASDRKIAAAKAAQAKTKTDNLWVRQQALAGQKFMAQAMVAAQSNPTETAYDDGIKAWDEWVDEDRKSVV